MAAGGETAYTAKRGTNGRRLLATLYIAVNNLRMQGCGLCTVLFLMFNPSPPPCSGLLATSR
jgi:hypothetical protein